MTIVIDGTTGISGVDGTASNPSYEGTDSNTGIFFPAADTVAIGTGGTEALRVNSSQNVGIGTTSQTAALDVVKPSFSGGPLIGARFNTSNFRMGFGVGNSNGFPFLGVNVNNAANDNGTFDINGYASRLRLENGVFQVQTSSASGTAGGAITWTTPLTLDASGNLMVGATSNGGGKVEVKQAATNESGIWVYSSATDSNGRFYCDNSAVGIAASFSSTGSFLPIVFRTSATERARITSGGYFKASDNGTYYGSGQTYHELRNSANALGVSITTPNASYANEVIRALVTRAQTSAYQFFCGYSNDGSDLEFNLRGDGNGYADGTWNNNGADYAEYFESATGAALTLGATVVLDGNKVREATDQDPASAIMGVVRPKEPSKASMVVGNTAWNKWANKYLTDDFDRYIMEDHDVLEWTDEEGKLQTYESHNIPAGVTVPDDAVVKTHDDKGNKFQHYKLNPAWNPDAEYVNRENRPEWIIVGLVGQVKVLKGQPVNDRWIKMRDVSATVEEWMIR